MYAAHASSSTMASRVSKPRAAAWIIRVADSVVNFRVFRGRRRGSGCGLRQRTMYSMAETEDRQVVVLSQILASDATTGYEPDDFYNLRVHSFNGQKVENLAALADMVEECLGGLGPGEGEGEYVEFEVGEHCARCVAYHPTEYAVACGFDDGAVRVFDIASTSLLEEYRQHRGPVAALAYAHAAHRLYSASHDGGLCAYDVLHSYQPCRAYAARARVSGQPPALSGESCWSAGTCARNSNSNFRKFDVKVSNANVFSSFLNFHCKMFLQPFKDLRNNSHAYLD